MRLSTEFWVSAYVRQCQRAGDFAAVTRKGAQRGGAIFIVINRLNGTADLYAPAPQSLTESASDDRIFSLVIEAGGEDKISQKLEQEAKFDCDLWVVERENQAGQHDLPLIKSSSV